MLPKFLAGSTLVGKRVKTDGEEGWEMSANGLVIGIDLCDGHTQAALSGNEKIWTFPTAICRKKDGGQWKIGDEAYALKLSGEGELFENLLTLGPKKEIFAGEAKASGRELLQRFLKQVLDEVKKECGTGRILQLVIALPWVNGRVMDCLLYCVDYLEVPRNRFHVVSYSESFLHYVLSQKKEVWANQVALFDFSKEGLRYCEMRIQRGARQPVVTAQEEFPLKELQLKLLDSFSGTKQADKLLYALGEKLLAKKLYSAILLTGKGFEKTDWAVSFMKLLCKRRKVYGEQFLYVKGALLRAEDFVAEETAFPYVMICEGRLKATVSMEVIHDDRPTQLVIAALGDSWYEAKSTMEFILDGQDQVSFMIRPADGKGVREATIPLEGFPKRPNRTTRIRMRAGFADEKTMVVVIQDKGFGELFPASNAMIRREIVI